MSTKNTTPSYTEIYAWGNDSNGQIGVSNTSGFLLPSFILKLLQFILKERNTLSLDFAVSM